MNGRPRVAIPELHNHERFAADIAHTLKGEISRDEGVHSYLSSAYDSFLNNVFAGPGIGVEKAASLLGGLPGYGWSPEEPSQSEADHLRSRGFHYESSQVMKASFSVKPPHVPDSKLWPTWVIAEDPRPWHRIYCDIFDADPRGLNDWERIHQYLGPMGQGSLILLMAGEPQRPNGIGLVYTTEKGAGLYCMGTIHEERGQGLGSSVLLKAHQLIAERGITDSVLEASEMGLPLYVQFGYKPFSTIHAAIAPDLRGSHMGEVR